MAISTTRMRGAAAAGRYRTVTLERDGEVHAQDIPGLRLAVAWFFQGPAFPSSLEVVTQLLGRCLPCCSAEPVWLAAIRFGGLLVRPNACRDTTVACGPG